MFLLDTNIVIDYFRNDKTVVKFITENLSSSLYISSITLAELYHGANKSSNPKRNISLIKRFVESAYIEVLGFDSESAKIYGKLMAQLELKGIKIASFDLAIVVLASQYKLKFVTKDKKHFARLEAFGIDLLLM